MVVTNISRGVCFNMVIKVNHQGSKHQWPTWIIKMQLTMWFLLQSPSWMERVTATHVSKGQL